MVSRSDCYILSVINRAQACNVFWRVDSADIGTTAGFKGTVLALNSITVANGANIEGRLLARVGPHRKSFGPSLGNPFESYPSRA